MKPHLQLITFAEDLALLLNSGADLSSSLTSLKDVQPDESFKFIVQALQSDVLRGENLSQAMANYPELFNSYAIGMVKSGEATGQLGAALTLLAEQLEKDQELKNQMVTAMIYPSILVGVMVISLMIIVGLILPTFTDLFASFSGELSSGAMVMLGIGQFIDRWGIWLLLGFLVVLAALWIFRRELQPAALALRMVKAIPSVGSALDKMEFARFTSTLSSLLAAGLTQTNALPIARESMTDQRNREHVLWLITRVQEGQSLGDSLAQLDGVGQSLAQSVRHGEQGRQLPQTLGLLSARLEKEFTRNAQRAILFIEPAIIIALGLVVGLVIFTVFSALQGLGSIDL